MDQQWQGKSEKGDKKLPQPEGGSDSHRVVLVQRLPPEVSVEDVIHHAMKLGKVTGRFVQEKTRHVFVEMSTQAEAQQLVQTLGTISIKGHSLKAEFSSRYAQVTEEQVNKVLVLSLPGLTDGSLDCKQLASIFNSKGGNVRKIQLWTSKDGVVQGLIEMDSNSSAQILREQLSGYVTGGTTIRLSYSNKPSIEIKQPIHGYDFVLNQGAGMCPRLGMGHQVMNHNQHHHHHHHAHHHMGGHHGHHHQQMGGKGGGGYPPMGGGGHHHHHHHHHHQHHHQQHHQHQHSMHRMDESTSVMVKNLVEGTSPDAIFRLFGTCGDVRAVKIMFKHRTYALVQYDSPRGADKACQFLHGCAFYEESRTLEVFPSKVGQITGPADELTKYFPDSLHHRFVGRLAHKNFENMCGPSTQLHISNVPVGIKNETVEAALRQFSDHATTKWIENKANAEVRTKMCIATLESVRSAVAALMGMHTICFSGHKPANGKGIVVSFSRRHMQRPDAHSGQAYQPISVVGANGIIADPTRPGSGAPGHP